MAWRDEQLATPSYDFARSSRVCSPEFRELLKSRARESYIALVAEPSCRVGDRSEYQKLASAFTSQVPTHSTSCPLMGWSNAVAASAGHWFVPVRGLFCGVRRNYSGQNVVSLLR